MYENKKILILGAAKSGIAVAKLLANKNNDIILTDLNELNKDIENELNDLGVKIVVTKNQIDLIDSSLDLVIKNPAIMSTSPLIKRCEELNLRVENEIEVAYHFLPDNIKIIGVKENNHKFDKVDGYVIRSYKVKHTAEAYGFVIEDNDNKKIGFTGDSCLCDGVEKIIKNSDVIFCDTSKLVGDDNAHMGCDNIIQLSSKYVDKKIITSHMYFDAKCEITKLNIPNLMVGNDGLEINI